MSSATFLVPPQATPTAVRKMSVLGEEPVERGQWTGPFDFLMSMIAYAVGLGILAFFQNIKAKILCLKIMLYTLEQYF